MSETENEQHELDSLQEQTSESENDNDEHEHEHRHKHRRRKSKVKPFAYSIVSFVLAFVLFIISVCAVLYSTIFSKEYMFNVMRSNSYYISASSELKERLENLCDASGFEKAFADNFVKGYDIQSDIEKYITAFYSGDNTLVDTTYFKQQLHLAIQNYITEKNIKVNNETQTNINYFVNEAAEIYVSHISIPFFSVIGNYIYKLKSTLNIVTISLTITALIITVLIFITNEYKHRRFRYMFHALAGATLAVLILPTIVLLSGKINKINFTDVSTYNLFVNYFNGLFYSFYIWAGVLAALSVISFCLYAKHYRHATN